MVSNLSVLEGIFEAKFQRGFFFEKKLHGFFSRIFFPKDFPSFFEKKFRGIFLQKHFVKRFPCKFTPWLETRSSLARAAFKRDFLYNQKGRRSIAGMAQQLESAP